MPTVLVVGGNGVLGSIVRRLAVRDAPDWRVLVGSRRSAPSATSRTLDVRSRATIDRALDGVDVVINAVGPFEYDAAPIVGACLEAGCHYFDIAETAPFLDRVAQTARASVAARSVVLPGCSTVPGLVAVLARAWDGRDDVDAVRVSLSLGSRKPVSATLLYSLLRPLGRPGADGARYYRALRRRTPRGESPRYLGRFPAPFEVAGLDLGSRRVSATFEVGMDRRAYSQCLSFVGRISPALPDAALLAVCRAFAPLTSLVTVWGKDLGVLALEALDDAGCVVDEIEIRAYTQGLNIPALPVVWAARAVLSNPERWSGLVGLDDLFSAADVAAQLREEGFEATGI